MQAAAHARAVVEPAVLDRSHDEGLDGSPPASQVRGERPLGPGPLDASLRPSLRSTTAISLAAAALLSLGLWATALWLVYGALRALP